MQYKAVIGLGFGDEGKGKVVNSLCRLALSKNSVPLVVRYSGGQQAAHTVYFDDGSYHVFSNFGSGAAHRVDTYWSKFCTVDPIGIINEYEFLKKKPMGRLIIDPDCPITTPYDKFANRNIDRKNNHGSCGVGVGQTWQRQEDHFSILANDLLFPSVLEIKVKNLLKFYYTDTGLSALWFDEFLNDCKNVLKICTIAKIDLTNDFQYNQIIFEGTQGLLLDQDFGFFPNVTRSSVGTKNIFHLSKTKEIELFLVTRAYQTRHGNGPMTDNRAFVNEYESNRSDTFQGKFKTGIFDLDLIGYALSSDAGIPQSKYRQIIINHIDVLEQYNLIHNRKLVNFDTEKSFIEYIKSQVGLNPICDDSPYSIKLISKLCNHPD